MKATHLDQTVPVGRINTKSKGRSRSTTTRSFTASELKYPSSPSPSIPVFLQMSEHLLWILWSCFRIRESQLSCYVRDSISSFEPRMEYRILSRFRCINRGMHSLLLFKNCHRLSPACFIKNFLSKGRGETPKANAGAAIRFRKHLD